MSKSLKGVPKEGSASEECVAGPSHKAPEPGLVLTVLFHSYVFKHDVTKLM